jgi:hypothetical protein
MIKLIDLLNEEINLEKYIEDWLGKGGAHDDSSINRAFTIKLKQLGYESFGTIYRVLIVKDIDKISNLRSYIWSNYKGKYLSFSKTFEGADYFMSLTSEDLYEGETFVIIKQKSNYYDLSKWVQDKEKEYKNKNQFYIEKGYWVGGLYNETQKTQEVLAILDNSFEIQGQYNNNNDGE